MLEGLSKYMEMKSHQEIKLKMTKNEPYRELQIVKRILKFTGNNFILDNAENNDKYPKWMIRIDAFNLLEMFAGELECGMYQRVTEIENTKRLIKELAEKQELLRMRERDVVTLERSNFDLQTRLRRAALRLQENGIDIKGIIEEV